MKTVRQYDKEFKLNAVKLCQSSDKGYTQIAKDLGIPKNTLYTWIQEYKNHGENSFPGSGQIRPEDQEMHRLKKELIDVKLERDILKKAVAIFSKAR